MRRSTSLMLAAALAVAGGGIVFQSLTATSGVINGTISGSSTSTSSSSSNGNASMDLFGNALVLGNEAPDGGAALNAIVINQDGCIKWPGTSASLCMSGNTLTVHVSDLITSTRHFSADACPAGSDCYTYADPGHWWYLFPQSGVTGCSSATKGGLRYNTDDNHYYGCNGSVPVPIANVFTGSAVLDFPSTSAMASSALTMTVTGAEPGDVAVCRANSSTEEGWIVRHAYVSSADEVTIEGFYMALAGSVDPTSRTYVCEVFR